MAGGVLRVIAGSIAQERGSINCHQKADILALHYRLAQEPTLVQFLHHVSVHPSQLPTFAVNFMHRSLDFFSFEICGSSSDCLVTLPLQERLTLCQFRYITQLALRGVVFATFTEFARVICGFQKLRGLHLEDVSYKTGEALSLRNMPFAASLSLRTVEVRFAGFPCLNRAISDTSLTHSRHSWRIYAICLYSDNYSLRHSSPTR